MNLKLIADSGDEPIAISDVTAALRYTVGDQDAYIGGLITAARILGEICNGRQLNLKQWDLALDRWPGVPGWNPNAMPDPYFGFWPSDAYRLMNGLPWDLHGIRLLAPLVSVDSVTYTDSTGTVTTMVEGTDYLVDTWKEPGLICPVSGGQWPAQSLWPTSAIHVQFTAGYVPDAAAYAAANPTLAPAPQVRKNICHGMMMLVSQWFADRVPYDAIRFVSEPPFAVAALFSSDKLWK
jgi:hypothetical protein